MPDRELGERRLDRVREEDGLVAEEVRIPRASSARIELRAGRGPLVGVAALGAGARDAIDAMRIADAPYVAASIQNASGRAGPRNATNRPASG